MLPIYWLSANTIAQLLDYTRCNTQDCWRSVDTLLMLYWCSVDPLLTLCWPSVDPLLTLCWPSVDPLLTLCWPSVDPLLTLCWHSLAGEAASTLTILLIQTANTSIVDKSRSTALGWYKMQHPNSLALCWRSFSAWGCDHVAFSFAHKCCQYVDYGQMP